MKASSLLALPLTYCVLLVLLSQEAQAKSSTDQVQENVEWTKDQVQAYLDKYHISYDKNDENLMETVQRYRDAAVANAGLFINDKTSSVQRLIDGLKIQLEKKYKLDANNVQSFTDDIQHELKQLELSGSLTQDKVKQSLDKLQHKAIKQKYVTAAQYKEIANELSSSFATPTWYQRIFHTGPSHSTHFTDDSFHTWISSSVTQRLQENKELTKEEINAVLDTLKKAIQSTSSSAKDLTKLASPAWWKQLSHDLEKNAKLQQNQAAAVVDSLKDEVNSYKIFAMDYAGDATQHSQTLLNSASRYLMDTGNYIYRAVVNPIKARESDANSAVSVASTAAASATDAAGSSASSLRAAATDSAYSAKDAAAASAYSAKDAAAASAASATDAAAASASVLRSQASQSVNHAKNNFGHFWRQKELETYKKVGYTEAHIDWVENYLSKTFHDKSNLAKETVHEAIRTVRQYLVQAKVQTAAHIDSQLKSLEGLIESWRRTVVRDEL
ncbi:hypothetical protein BDF21DRAFT_490496 [Thamnidium elegans]|uniref:Uncharacterized protein n=1 Tax=Thamnidium elegans TaxID=101142 RepID=A0A8H7SXE8_9FUNG|nr:hypothetical protein INT48_003780 [Thamnidium elegans]KAI8091807.1 hypothetical protein BDF21DRAFT_490496 [Thamnidium elegans]